MVGKYFSGEIRANKVILFSNKGFSKPVIERSKKLGIELLQPKKLGNPIIPMPYIVTVGYVNQMLIEITHAGPQQTFMNINADEYVILKGIERISFYQFVYRKIVNTLRNVPELNLRIEVGSLKLEEANVLYELKSKPGYRYNGCFSIEVKLKWDFFAEDLHGALILHVNMGDCIQVNLQGSDQEILSKVLLSPTKRNYNNRIDCISNESKTIDEHFALVCIANSDQPIFSII